MTHRSNPSQRWTSLVNSAVLGTERARPPIERGYHPWIVNDSQSNAAATFLDEAASLGVYELAGRSTCSIEVREVTVFQADERVCSPQAGRHLSSILYGGREAVLVEWCDTALAAGLIAPPELIPSLLTRARSTRDDELRQSLLAISGERGAWLADLNLEWRLLVASDVPIEDLIELWESGQRNDRLSALARLRQTAPREAVQLIAVAWKAEPAADRLRLLGVLEKDLTTEDEPWLENCLDDGSKQVRAAAAELLSMLPESALAHRMSDRVAEFVKLKPGLGVFRKKKSTVEFTAPEKLDDLTKRDSLEEKAVGGLGAKASLLRRLTALTPLSAWTRGSHPPAEWLAAAAASDWTDALIQGWTEAASRQRNASWSEALLGEVCFVRPDKDTGMYDEWRVKQIEPLITSLPREAAERLACDAVVDGGRHTPTKCVGAALVACDFPWGDELSDAVARMIGNRLAGSDIVYDQPLRQLIGVAAIRVSPGMADRIAREWTAKQEHWSANFAQIVHEAVDTIRLRRDMLAAIRETPLSSK